MKNKNESISTCLKNPVLVGLSYTQLYENLQPQK